MEKGDYEGLALPCGVRLTHLDPHEDARGSFTEIFRGEWPTGVAPVQWNVVRSVAGVLRGVHVHLRHDDYLLLLEGEATVGLRDLRPTSPTRDLAVAVELGGGPGGRSGSARAIDGWRSISIPHGVAHGFYFHRPSLHVYAVSEYFDPADELACHWQDPELEISWPTTSARVSPRDAAAPPLSDLLRTLERAGGAAVRPPAR